MFSQLLKTEELEEGAVRSTGCHAAHLRQTTKPDGTPIGLEFEER